MAFAGLFLVDKLYLRAFTCNPALTFTVRNLQAEIAMREAGKPGMSDEEVCLSTVLQCVECNLQRVLTTETEAFFGDSFAGGRFCFAVPSCIQRLPSHPLLRRTKWVGSKASSRDRNR